MRKSKPIVSILCAAALAVSALSACTSATSGNVQETSAQTESADSGKEGAEEKDEQTKKEEIQEEKGAENAGGSATDGGIGNKQPFTLTSREYVEAMGHGWNLGNSFDGVDTDESEEDKGETEWGNPTVTRELIHAIKEQGFNSIRIPMTMFKRYTEENGKAVVDEDWLARYKEVVDWAVEEGLYVMINIHHDSWIWLKYWDGDKEAEEYVRFVQLWEQLADYFKDEPEQVCFETINEPDFEGESDEEKQEKLDAINLAAYDVIRASGGNNAERMIVIPTMNTNHEKCDPLLKLIQDLDDTHIIATVHYYGEWVFSANLGITGFDEAIDDDGKTARTAADSAMETVYKTFTQNDIGVVIGEYGVLGYDQGEKCNQPGEELKYYEYVNELARKYGLCLMFWDNGSGIDRVSGKYEWKKPQVGEMLWASMEGRSSYAAELDTLYFGEEAEEDVLVALTLNGNTFTEIEGLTEGEEYSYDESTATVTLSKDYINKMYAESSREGRFGELVFTFSSGADWTEKLVRFKTPEFKEASGTTEGLTIPADYHGADIRRISAFSGEEHTGPQSSWWKYLQNSEAFDVEDDALVLNNSFFNECAEGEIKLVIEFYDGQIKELWLTKDGDKVSVKAK